MADINQIIATINPDLYCDGEPKDIKKFKELIKKEGFQKAADSAKPKPLAKHGLVYDSASETLEPVYFFIVDLLSERGLEPEKIIDNFASSPGGGHFAEIGQRASLMQQNATRILGDVNTVLRSVLNIIYDLKEFKTRLQYYADTRAGDKNKQEASILSLKQIWLDRVDMGKGNSSVKAMAIQGGFQTLLDAFLIVNNAKDVDNLDLNDRVKRILKPRIEEFNLWLRNSEQELRKRYELERNYLRSQVNSLKLYSRWAKPYLRAAQQLETKELGKSPDIVKAFNTIVFELTLFGKTKLNLKELALKGTFPKDFAKDRIARTVRDYYNCIVVDFNFRGIPQRVGQSHYAFGGKAGISFKAYALNTDELNKLNKELENSEVEDVLKLIEGVAGESLEKLQEEINSFLEETTEEKIREKIKDESNPFLALIGKYNREETGTETKKPAEKEKPIRAENYLEKEFMRKEAMDNATKLAFDLFDIYKKGHGMPSYT